MATYASRPAWRLRTRTLAGPRVAIPLGLGALVAVSLLIRTREISIGFWIDEGISTGIADRAIGAIPHALREDGAPPLYYMALHYWLKLAGDSEAGVRSLSLFFALLAIPAAFWAGRAIWGSRRAAWMAAVLMAFNPFLSQYAQEARMYTLIALLAIPVVTCFLRAYAIDLDERRRPWIAGFALSLAASLYTHNWSIFLTLSCLVSFAWLYLISDRRRELLRDGLLGFGGALVLYLPWVPTTLYQAAHTGAPWSDAPDVGSLSDVPTQLLGRMPQVVLLLCAGAGVLALLSRRDAQQRFGERGRAVLCLAVLGAGTILLAWIASQLSPAWANRYLAVALPPFVLLAAGGLAFAGRLGLVGLVLGGVMWSQDAAPVEKSNVRAIAQAVAPSLQPGDLVITTQPETVAVLHYYLPPGLRYATLTGPLRDVGVWDWRDGVQRLRATTPRRDLQPLLDGLAPGRRIALFSPITSTPNRWRAPWTKLIRLRAQEWAQYLGDDPRFPVTASLPENFESPRPNPVQATVL